MNKKCFFFQGDNLLLPLSAPEPTTEVSMDLLKCFSSYEIFEVPSLDVIPEIINVADIAPSNPLPADWHAIPVRQVLTILAVEKQSAARLFRAFHIAKWRHDSRFCGTCGAENKDAPCDISIIPPPAPHRVCPRCGRLEFPRICPAIIVLITNEKNEILLAHNKKFKQGLYSHISGFNEAGETLEETVAREIREEINIEVKNIEYVKSQPWPLPNSFMVGFKAQYLSGEIKPDGTEIDDARWFSKDNLPEIPAHGSLSRVLIDMWLGL